jgi:hypothetical protein
MCVCTLEKVLEEYVAKPGVEQPTSEREVSQASGWDWKRSNSWGLIDSVVTSAMFFRHVQVSRHGL